MLALVVVAMPAWGASDPRVEDLALCRDSWLDWKSTDPSQLESFGAFLRSGFAHDDNDAFFTPKSDMTIAGLKVIQVFPGSLGMGLGFSVRVDASFDAAKQVLERELGMPLGDCENSDGLRTCELSIAEQRTVMLVSADAPNGTTTLVGCYYFYEK
jgi:hypothetical protein